MTAGRYQVYPEYRDSGVEWLGEVPKKWTIFEGKRIFGNRREISYINDQQLSASQHYGIIPQALMMDRNNSKVMLALKGTDCFRHVEKNDFVISLRSFEGGIEYSAYQGCVSPAYTVLEPEKKIVHYFFRYLLKSRPFITALQSTTDSLRDGKSITYHQFGNIPLVFPSNAEQAQIAAFLDHETAKIDTLIEKQQKLIALLKEKRQAVISHAVTKGLNPDAPMKDSGVEWLGEVPADWLICRIKFFCQLNPSKSELKSMHPDTEVTFLPMEAIGEFGQIDRSREKCLDALQTGYTYVGEGDVCIAKITPCFENGKGAVATGLKNGVAFATTEVIPLRCNLKNDSYYLYYLLTSSPFKKIAEGSMYGAGGQKRVSDSFVANYSFPLPPFTERQHIVVFLNNETTKIDALINKAQRSIELSKERRTALISAAVTGKIDVRNWQPPTAHRENQ